MPRDGSGIYTLPAGNPVVTNTLIASTWANTTLSDIAAQLNNVFTRDGLLGPTGPFKVVDGTVVAPGLAFNSEPGLGFFRIGARQVAWAAGGAQTFRLDATAPNILAALNPSAAGFSDFALANAPSTAVDYNVLRLRQRADGTASITGEFAGTATAKQLTISGFSVVNAPQEFISPLLRVHAGYYLSHDTNSNYIGYIPNTFISQSKVNGALFYTNNGTGGSGRTTTIANSAGDFVSGKDIYVAGDYPALIGSAPGSRRVMFAPGWYIDWSTSNGNLSWFRDTAGLGISINQFGFDLKYGTGFKPSGGTWDATSDIRLKNVHGNYEQGLDAILALRPVRFAYKATPDKEYIGLVAQEAMVPMPELVTIRDMDGYEDLHTLDASAVTWALVNAVKTLHERIAALETP